MGLITTLIPIKQISSKVERSIFDEANLTELAKLILEAKGLIHPLIIESNDLRSYYVVKGDFEYYAALKAYEIDPKKANLINVLVIEEPNGDALLKQVDLLRNNSSSIGNNTSSDMMGNKISYLERTISNFKEQWLEENQKYQTTITQLLTGQQELKKMVGQLLSKSLTEQSTNPLPVVPIVDEVIIKPLITPILPERSTSTEEIVPTILPTSSPVKIDNQTDLINKKAEVSTSKTTTKKNIKKSITKTSGTTGVNSEKCLKILNKITDVQDVVNLTHQLKSIGVKTPDKVANKIYEERKIRPFTTVEEAIDRIQIPSGARFIRPLKKEKMLELIKQFPED